MGIFFGGCRWLSDPADLEKAALFERRNLRKGRTYEGW